jgi:hypothetical protein
VKRNIIETSGIVFWNQLGAEEVQVPKAQDSGQITWYCKYCGKELPSTASFCMNCGRPAQQVEFATQTTTVSPSTQAIQPLKNEGLASILSLFGLGHIYLGKLKKGIPILLFLIVSFIIASSAFSEASTLSHLLSNRQYDYIFENWGLRSQSVRGLDAWVRSTISRLYATGILFGILFLGSWIWQMFDTYKLAKQYNEKVRTQGKAPW